jgi:hypothetical protein
VSLCLVPDRDLLRGPLACAGIFEQHGEERRERKREPKGAAGRRIVYVFVPLVAAVRWEEE